MEALASACWLQVFDLCTVCKGGDWALKKQLYADFIITLEIAYDLFSRGFF